MRCPDCSKFVPFDEPEVEVQSAEVQDTNLDLEVRVVLKCADCGCELKDADLSDSIDLTQHHECKKDRTDENGDEIIVDDEFTMDNEPDAEGFDRYQDKDRHGKPIKSMRYMKHYYGATLNCTCKCGRCDEEFSFTTTLEEQASGFNELT
jgi:hypothetical protein